MTEKDAFLFELQERLNELVEEIEKLTSKAYRAGAGTLVEYHRQVDYLLGRREMATGRLHELKMANEQSWRNYKERAECACEDLSDAVRSAWAYTSNNRYGLLSRMQ